MPPPAGFPIQLWARFVAQRPEPDDPTLRYGGAGRSEENLCHSNGAIAGVSRQQ
jgi:hypothetical protein